MVNQYKRTDTVRLAPNFRLDEFKCKCGKCSPILVDDKLVEILQKIRDHFGASVNVNSGYRCAEHNAEVGGDSGSHHMRGMAADIRVKGIAPEEVAKYAESIGVKRIGLYDSFVHIGSADTKNYWKDKSSNKVDTFGGQTVAVTLPVLGKGMKGGAVFGLQALLLGYGYDLGEKKLDGSFGGKTEQAVKQFQYERDLTPDGTVDTDTWTELLSV